MSQPQTTETAIVTPPSTISLNFTKKVEAQFAAELGSGVQWTDIQRRLAQHLFIKCDQALKSAEAKRDANKQKTSITWENINMSKLALDAVHRVSLGLDALIPNHIWPIAYWNSSLGKYDLDLRVGYVGELCCHIENAVERPKEVVIHLVHETDEFVAHMKGLGVEIESYTFKPTSPFNRGKVVGGFGYIAYDDPTKNRLIIVDERDFNRAKSSSKGGTFWSDHEEEMKYKTVVHRVAQKIPLDPQKVNASSLANIASSEIDYIDAEVSVAVEANANTQSLEAVAVPAPVVTTSSRESAPEEQAVPVQPEAAVPVEEERIGKAPTDDVEEKPEW